MKILNRNDHALAVPLFAPWASPPAFGLAYVPQVGLVPLMLHGQNRIVIGAFHATTDFGPFANTDAIRHLFSEITR